MSSDPHHEARMGLAYADGSDRGWITVSGAEAAGFLQRLVSSDVRRLHPGLGQWSALLDGKGHWEADLLLFQTDAQQFALDLPASRVERVLHLLDLYHFGERLEFRAVTIERTLLLGPSAPEVLAACGLPLPEPAECALARGDSTTILRRPDRGAPCLELLGPIEILRPRLQGAARAFEDTLERLRIEAGIPRFGADFGPDSTLPESNEWHRAALDKGCYAGQEVVARVNTYGDAPWQLCRLELEQPVPAGSTIEDEAGKSIGRLTSAAGAAALGVLRRRHALEGRHVWAAAGNGRVTATVRLRPRRLG